ncbi:hypothetical protein A2763_00800 [Candidatus Kaiserbacteria bacterium RIFCSPHIGHO2_01_FULL_54_36]|uniref:ACT domain-containing protein n=1 Tax=Candidatus Kaiserbacteria bacterium RIFCSPHIGHO2_01_FULL_54_36 TaxID=1798482 RepID=A0A1F6CPC4_9BACT|nr:MAG: hypothetical protein A2763_00800 [Candidatus Kaiserbacteria bacterium RIFCSPHIGHO2_01_FULL_54_36]OGG75566.1 MAG: hypothetical protein A3A41_03005 [Candidatus Kaiserbacteria bacterium RIFCSPLOWO2_01_FULL_54_22]
MRVVKEVSKVDSTSQCTRLLVTVTGDFDKNGVRRIRYALGKFGSVEQILSFPRAGNLRAAAKFAVTTAHDAVEIETALRAIREVRTVTMGANHA